MTTSKSSKPEWDELVLEIMMLAYAVDRRTGYAVFIEYSGHVQNLSIKIVESAENWRSTIADSDFSVAGKYISSDPLAYYKQKRDVLKAILDEGEVNYSALEQIRSEVVDYVF